MRMPLSTAVLSLIVLVWGVPPPATVAAEGAPRFELNVPVLYYHHIACWQGIGGAGYFTCPEAFEAQLTGLRDAGWQAITVDRLADYIAARECPPARTFVVSLDDGQADAYYVAAPILEKLGMPGTFFVVAGFSGRPGVLTFDQMRDLVARGHAIGNHSLTHPSLPTLTDEALYEQVEGAQDLLASELGFRPRTFAYPAGRYGRSNDRVINAVRDSHFELAFTIVRGAREATDSPMLSKRLRTRTIDSGSQTIELLEPFADGCRPPRADLALATSSAGPWKGENVYSQTIKSKQTVQRTVASGRTYSFVVRNQDDAQRADHFQLQATVSGPIARVRFLIAGVDVSNQILDGTYMSPFMEPWSRFGMRVEVTTVSAPAGSVARIDVVSRPDTNPSSSDKVRIRLAY